MWPTTERKGVHRGDTETGATGSCALYTYCYREVSLHGRGSSAGEHEAGPRTGPESGPWRQYGRSKLERTAIEVMDSTINRSRRHKFVTFANQTIACSRRRLNPARHNCRAVQSCSHCAGHPSSRIVAELSVQLLVRILRFLQRTAAPGMVACKISVQAAVGE